MTLFCSVGLAGTEVILADVLLARSAEAGAGAGAGGATPASPTVTARVPRPTATVGSTSSLPVAK